MPFASLHNFFSRYHPQTFAAKNWTRAAVLCPLFYDENQELKILLIKRSQKVSSHKGEISFPGGARDSQDLSLTETCLRETEEEIGIPPTSITILGLLDEVKTTSGYLVTPFLGVIDGAHPLQLSRDEVEEIIIVGLDELLNPGNQIDFYYFNGRLLQPQIAFRCGRQVIWGATARIIIRLLELMQTHGLHPRPQTRKFHLAS